MDGESFDFRNNDGLTERQRAALRPVVGDEKSPAQMYFAQPYTTFRRLGPDLSLVALVWAYGGWFFAKDSHIPLVHIVPILCLPLIALIFSIRWHREMRLLVRWGAEFPAWSSLHKIHKGFVSAVAILTIGILWSLLASHP